MDRRRFLKASPVIGTVGLAGCVDLFDDDEPEETQTPTPTPEDSPTQTPAPVQQPEILSFVVSHTNRAGELSYKFEISVEDDSIKRIELDVDAEIQLSLEPDTSHVEESGTVSGEPGFINLTELTATTSTGGRLTSTTNQYVRKFDVVEFDTDLEIVPFLQDLDGITTWLGDRHDDEGKFLDMDGWFDREKIEFSYLYDFAEQHDLEFIPTVQPGFTEKHSDCYAYDEPRHVGRSLEFFKDMLELALEYQTMNRIHVASYNDWNEGHQIEPGWMPDEDYGYTYLEAIEARLEAADDTG